MGYICTLPPALVRIALGSVAELFMQFFEDFLSGWFTEIKLLVEE